MAKKDTFAPEGIQSVAVDHDTGAVTMLFNLGEGDKLFLHLDKPLVTDLREQLARKTVNG